MTNVSTGAKSTALHTHSIQQFSSPAAVKSTGFCHFLLKVTKLSPVTESPRVCFGKVKKNGEESVPESCDMIQWILLFIRTEDQLSLSKCKLVCKAFISKLESSPLRSSTPPPPSASSLSLYIRNILKAF